MINFLQRNDFKQLILVFFIAYNCLFDYKLPSFMVSLANNPIVRIIVLTLIGFLGHKNLQVSLFFSIAFVLVLSLVNNNNLLNGVDEVTENSENSNVVNNSNVVDNSNVVNNSNAVNNSNNVNNSNIVEVENNSNEVNNSNVVNNSNIVEVENN